MAPQTRHCKNLAHKTYVDARGEQVEKRRVIVHWDRLESSAHIDDDVMDDR